MSDSTKNREASIGTGNSRDFLSINALKEKELENIDLLPNERLAIKNFDRHRITELNKQPSENKFHQKYKQLQVMANLTPFEEFLKEEYFV